MLTGSELRRIFQVGVGEEVPEYEVVNIHHRRHRRSADSQAVHQVYLIFTNHLAGCEDMMAVHMMDVLITAAAS